MTFEPGRVCDLDVPQELAKYPGLHVKTFTTDDGRAYIRVLQWNRVLASCEVLPIAAHSHQLFQIQFESVFKVAMSRLQDEERARRPAWRRALDFVGHVLLVYFLRRWRRL